MPVSLRLMFERVEGSVSISNDCTVFWDFWNIMFDFRPAYANNNNIIMIEMTPPKLVFTISPSLLKLRFIRYPN